MPGRRDVREPSLVHRPHEKVAGSVSRKNAPGAIGPVGSGRQTHDEHAGAWIAESWNGPAPVRVVSMRGFLVLRDLLAVRAQPCTPVAPDDVSNDYRPRRLRHPA